MALDLDNSVEVHEFHTSAQPVGKVVATSGIDIESRAATKISSAYRGAWARNNKVMNGVLRCAYNVSLL